MELGDALRKRAAELSAASAQLPGRFRAIAQKATKEAVEEAAVNTPNDNDGKERGTLMITGVLAQHWADDSQIDPVAAGDEYQTALANNVQYASFVNDGHNLYPHFVPGLVPDPVTGLLERVDPETPGAGMMVGTKTSYVPGLYMKEKALDKYKEVVESELKKLGREVLGE